MILAELWTADWGVMSGTSVNQIKKIICVCVMMIINMIVERDNNNDDGGRVFIALQVAEMV